MWYVIQTAVGNENNMIESIDRIVETSTYSSCFCILAENMRRKEGRQLMYEELLFKGYVFVETETPTAFYEELKRVEGMTRLLSEEYKVDDDSFLQVRAEEQAFLEGITDDSYVVRLSLVKRSKSNRVIALDGPMLIYEDSVLDVDYRHRRAFVGVSLLGQERQIKLGICTEDDLRENGMIERLEAIREKRKIENSNPYEIIDKWDWRSRNKYRALKNRERMEQADMTIELEGISAGMKIKEATGLYGDKELTVKSVNVNKRTVTVEAEIFGSKVDVELKVGDVEAV